MAEISWTSQALEDIESICEFIARDAPTYASVFADRVIRSVGRLRDFPLSGRVVPELNRENIREILYGNYRMIYQATEEKVDILTVYHGARLLGPVDVNK